MSKLKANIQLDEATRDELKICKGVYGLTSYNDVILYLLSMTNDIRTDMMAINKEDTADV